MEKEQLNQIIDDIYNEGGHRDQLATVDDTGKRIWIFPKKPSGFFYKWRTYVSWGLLAVLFILPFIKVNGDPLILLDILDRHFIIFGVHFAPQDFNLFVLAMLTSMVFIVFFTVIYGRLFCGWVCPQTIFMEMVFRKIEYWIDGDANAQRKLAKAPWTTEKIQKRLAKHSLFVLISALVAHTFLSYIIGVDEVLAIVTQPPAANLGGFIAMVAFTGAFYIVFSLLREQVCTTICPYGRLQGVLTDNNTILVSYDFVRGEPRGRIKKTKKKQKAAKKHVCKCTDCANDGCKSAKKLEKIGRKIETEVETTIAAKAAPTSVVTNPIMNIQSAVTMAANETEIAVEEVPLKLEGDCIDCKLCVRVCPTGIDIRDGVQLECINCTACIDVCDEVMEKVGRPKGLIRYDSYNGIKEQKRNIFTPRVKAYSAVLIALMALNIFLLTSRSAVEAVILREPGTLYYQELEGQISNLYSYKIFNKTNAPMPLELRVQDEAGRVRIVGKSELVIPKNEMIEGKFFVDMTHADLSDQKEKIRIEVYSAGKKIESAGVVFLSPAR